MRHVGRLCCVHVSVLLTRACTQVMEDDTVVDVAALRSRLASDLAAISPSRPWILSAASADTATDPTALNGAKRGIPAGVSPATHASDVPSSLTPGCVLGRETSSGGASHLVDEDRISPYLASHLVDEGRSRLLETGCLGVRANLSDGALAPISRPNHATLHLRTLLCGACIPPGRPPHGQWTR